MPRDRDPLLLRRRPPVALGMATAIVGVALVTVAVAGLRHLAPVVSLSVLYLIPVLAVSVSWGLVLGTATSLLGAVVFNFFFLPPTGRLTIADSRNWAALVAFLVVALVTSTLADTIRARAREAQERREEADLGADLARTLLGGTRLSETLALGARRVAELVGAGSAAIELEAVAADEARLVLPLAESGAPIGSLVVPASLAPPQQERLRERVVPVLESVLAAALARERLQSEVVETAALRRSDEIKTAILRSVSHDLRTPVTAVLAGVRALRSTSLTAQERADVEADVADAARRLSALIDKLLDLARIQGGTAPPQRTWCSVDEVLHEAADAVQAGSDQFRFSMDPDLPLVRADPVQLERALANLMENAARYGAGHPVSVRARVVGHRLMIRIVDQGPGIARQEQERIFTPFYRGSSGGAAAGSGLGLAIARGFIEANGGRLTVESLPSQGTTFVIQLPLEAVDDAVGLPASA
jgi:two-component system sensor histidine kinase KdpD